MPVNLRGRAGVNPLLEFLHLGFGPRAVARHLAAAQGADDSLGVVDDILVIEQIKGSQQTFGAQVRSRESP